MSFPPQKEEFYRNIRLQHSEFNIGTIVCYVVYVQCAFLCYWSKWLLLDIDFDAFGHVEHDSYHFGIGFVPLAM